MSDSTAKNDLTLLGRSETSLPSSPEEATLETFDNKNKSRDYWIKLDCPEFSSLCPVTGQPDSARISIRYVPDALCVETKSLKFYLASFRNQPGFNEEIANRIADDLIAVCNPRKLVVEAQFAPRGGISLMVEVVHPQS
jgi:7-cyano-7-deazaguanine reductase